MDEVAARKLEVFGPLYLEAGLALLDCQTLEAALSVVLLHVHRIRARYQDPTVAKLGEFLADVDRRTCGQLVSALRQYTDLSTDASEALAGALVARNQIVHRVLASNHARFLDADLRAGLIEEIRALRGSVLAGVDFIAPTVILLNESEFGILDADVQREVREALGFEAMPNQGA